MGLLAPRVVDKITTEPLDELWREAESLGRVEVDNTWVGAVMYTVEIKFDRRSGSSIRAKGTNQNIAFALADAIREARILGAAGNG